MVIAVRAHCNPLDNNNIYIIHKYKYKYYKKALVSDRDLFEKAIMNQPLWGYK